jgi:formate hydrogenlyase transcriptional activator
MRSEIEAQYELDEIVGESAVLKSVLWQARIAAKSDSAVLLTGERGTGKELIARAIHRMGNRRRQSFVKVDCSSVPPARLEAVLFGHDRGRLEAANLGTLLLKRVESISEDFEPKFLQVFEQKEFRRPGNPAIIAADARLIATLSDGGHRVEDSWLFRNVSPRLNLAIIRVPALRERRGDIPLLAWYFLRKWARRANKLIDVISPHTMKLLVNYSWPDNVGELDNLIERSVRSSEGPELSSETPIEREKRA